MNITNKSLAQDVIRDCVSLARMEGLEGHARAAECRLDDNNSNSDEQIAKKAKK